MGKSAVEKTVEEKLLQIVTEEYFHRWFYGAEWTVTDITGTVRGGYAHVAASFSMRNYNFSFQVSELDIRSAKFSRNASLNQILRARLSDFVGSFEQRYEQALYWDRAREDRLKLILGTVKDAIDQLIPTGEQRSMAFSSYQGKMSTAHLKVTQHSSFMMSAHAGSRGFFRLLFYSRCCFELPVCIFSEIIVRDQEFSVFQENIFSHLYHILQTTEMDRANLGGAELEYLKTLLRRVDHRRSVENGTLVCFKSEKICSSAFFVKHKFPSWAKSPAEISNKYVYFFLHQILQGRRELTWKDNGKLCMIAVAMVAMVALLVTGVAIVAAGFFGAGPLEPHLSLR